MLKHLRSKTKIIIWSVVICFVLWGGFSVGVQFQKKGRYAGEVFGKAVSFQEFDRFYRLTQLFGLPGETAEDSSALRKRTWENIVLAREAKDKNIQVSDEEVRDQIRKIFAAQGISDLTPEVYNRWLERFVRLPPRTFENQLREFIRVQKLLSAIYKAPVEPPSHEEIEERYLMDQKQIILRKLIFPGFETAQAFQEEFKASGDFESVIARYPELKTEAYEKMNRADFLKKFPKSERLALNIFSLNAGEISPLLEEEDRYYFLYAADVELPGPASPTPEQETEIRKKIMQEKRDFELLKWNIELFQRAAPKDFQLQD